MWISSKEATIDIPKDEYRAIADQIHSDQSPVGIDAKKTHIMILHQLSRIEKRLQRLEEAMGAASDPEKT